MKSVRCICGGEMLLEKQADLNVLQQDRIFMNQDYFPVAIYVCEDCGRVEFFKRGFQTPEEREVDAEEWYQVLQSFADSAVQLHAKDATTTKERRAAAQRVLDERAAAGKTAPQSVQAEEKPQKAEREKTRKGFFGFGKKKEKDPWD